LVSPVSATSRKTMVRNKDRMEERVSVFASKL